MYRRMAKRTFTLGIDLGTTHTVVSHHGKAMSLDPAKRGPYLLPSVLAFLPDGTELLGAEARERRVIDPKNTLRATKRLIGARLGSERAQRYAEYHPYELCEKNGMAAIRTRTGVVDPVDVATRILNRAVQVTGHPASECSAVITVAAAFGPAERAATIEAAERVGFSQLSLVTEPVATAIAYLGNSSLRYAAVYDLGGGTFDFAVVDCTEYPLKVLANDGDAYLGGEDVDRELATQVAAQVLREHRWDLTADRVAFARLIAFCELAKVELSKNEETRIDLLQVDPAGPWTTEGLVLTQKRLIEITQHLVRRTFGVCDQVLSQAEIRVRDIDAVFLAGGSTALPNLAHTIKQYFGKRPRHDLNPMHVVAGGASLAAARPDLAGLLKTKTKAAPSAAART